MQSLHDYIRNGLQDAERVELFEGLIRYEKLNGFLNLLNTCFVLRNAQPLPLPLLVYENLGHTILIDECIVYLLKKRLFNNVLTYGYKIGQNHSVSANLHCTYTNTCVSTLKNVRWQQVHKVMGSRSFTDLLINTAVLEFNGSYFTQMIGNQLNRPYHFLLLGSDFNIKEELPDAISKPVFNTDFLYKNATEFRYYMILPGKNHVRPTREKIFDPSLVTISKTLEVQIDKQISNMLDNHRYKVRYSAILNNICPRSNEETVLSHLEAQVPRSQVLRFLIVVLEKLLPAMMFGSKHNKSKIFKKISNVLNLPLHGSIPFTEIMRAIRIEDMSWLHSANGAGTSNKETLTSFFVAWVFKQLVPNILASAFYCTNVSSELDILYFRHDVWNSISAPFLQTYFDEYLDENHTCRNHSSYMLSEYNHSKLRVIPKRANNEFRVIAVPRKGFDDEERAAYKENYKSIIFPIQSVLEYLRHKRKTNFKKICSPTDIVESVATYKELLMRKYKQLPKIYFMKFDIACCYDSAPRKKIIEVLYRALQDISGFFVRMQTFYNYRTNVIKTKYVVNGSKIPSADEIYIDNMKTTYFSKEDLLKILDLELFKTALLYNQKCYLRKDGLFQGSSLSALLVDILYDDLLEHYDEFQPKSNADTVLLRLADDFLVLSTDEQQIDDIKTLAIKGFREYNAFVNKSKVVTATCTTTYNMELEFCALHLLIDKLEILKTSQTLSVSNMRYLPPKKVFNKLKYFVKARVSYGTINHKLNSLSTILHQLEHITKNLADIFILAFKHESFNMCLLVDFIDFMISHITNVASSQGLEKDKRYILKSAVIDVFLGSLENYKSRYKKSIKYLKSLRVPISSKEKVK